MEYFPTGYKDVDRMILNKLDDKDLVNVCQTNTKANEICNDQTFWMKRILMKFPMVSQEVLRKYKGNRSWSDYYTYDLRKINYNSAQEYLKKGAEEGRLDHVIIAIGMGADIHAQDDHALRWASANGRLEVVKYLVENKADIHVGDDWALRLASEFGHLEVVKYLVKEGADIVADNDYALRWASRNGHLEEVKYLQSVMDQE